MYQVIETAEVNGATVQLRRLETDGASAYVIVSTRGGKATYANFSNRSVAEHAMHSIKAMAYS